MMFNLYCICPSEHPGIINIGARDHPLGCNIKNKCIETAIHDLLGVIFLIVAERAGVRTHVLFADGLDHTQVLTFFFIIMADVWEFPYDSGGECIRIGINPVHMCAYIIGPPNSHVAN